MPTFTTTLLLLTVLIVVCATETYAFGAGDIPDFAFLNDRAYRHGDIENILTQLVKSIGHAGGAGGILGFAQAVIKEATGGAKFDKGDIKKVYFGNWLRDYSQAMDIAGLSKLTSDTLVLVVAVLGFMEFGLATEEFEVTAERLGVYLPVEHIDNPKGYAAKEGDARQFHPKLRPPVDNRELEIDPRTGMKNYMATENRGWDTSTAHVRRVFRSCIDYGRRARGQEGADLWEAYRLLGTGLHTMEDLLAHSNWCELALRKMGHQSVFCHVGDSVLIDTPNGRAAPLVTGTFGGADFLHSLLGEATDKLSQASVTDLAGKMDQAANADNSQADALKSIIAKLALGDSDQKMQEGEKLQTQSQAYNFDPNNVAPPEVQQQLISLLKWHDDVYRDVVKKVEMVPGLSDMLENLTNALNAYVYTVLAPYLTPILQQVTGVLHEGSKAVISSEDQFEVFDNPRASDPSHSMLSKDHFGLILNEPAGKIAQLVVIHSVNLIVQAWFDEGRNPDQTINEILEAFHHPYYNTGRSQIQHLMYQEMEKWLGGLGPDEARQTLQALTKENVRNGKNKRLGSENQSFEEPGYAHGPAMPAGRPAQSGGYAQQQGAYGGSGGGRRTDATSGVHTAGDSYGSGRATYESGRTGTTHGVGRTEPAHGGSQATYGDNRRSDNTYGGRGRDDEDAGGDASGYQPSYGRAEERSGYGASQGRAEERSSYGASPGRAEERIGYGASQGRAEERTGYGASHGHAEERSGHGASHGRAEEHSGHGASHGRAEERSGHGASHGRAEEHSGYGASHGRAEERSGYGASQGSYGSSNRQAGQRDEYGSSGYNRGDQNSGGNYQSREDNGYQPSYGRQEATRGARNETGYDRSEGREDGTYGVGRLNLNDDDDDDDNNRRRRHGGY